MINVTYNNLKNIVCSKLEAISGVQSIIIQSQYDNYMQAVGLLAANGNNFITPRNMIAYISNIINFVSSNFKYYIEKRVTSKGIVSNVQKWIFENFNINGGKIAQPVPTEHITAAEIPTLLENMETNMNDIRRIKMYHSIQHFSSCSSSSSSSSSSSCSSSSSSSSAFIVYMNLNI